MVLVLPVLLFLLVLAVRVVKQPGGGGCVSRVDNEARERRGLPYGVAS